MFLNGKRGNIKKSVVKLLNVEFRGYLTISSAKISIISLPFLIVKSNLSVPLSGLIRRG